MSSLGTNLIQVIKDKEFQAVTKDLTEVVIDSNIAEGLLKDVPLLSTIIGTFNTVTNIKDKLFEQAIERAAAAPLAYGYFALETQDEIHLSAAKLQLGVE